MSEPENKSKSKAVEKSEPTATVTVTDLSKLIQDAVDARLAEIMTAKSPDDRIRDAMERQRGIGVPTAAEFLVPCVSPITKAKFTARLIASKSLGARVVELLDYERPAGWDTKKQDGGIVPDGDQMPLKDPQTGKPGSRYVKWLYETFWQRDAAELGGKQLPDQWRATYAPEPGSVTLSPEQIQRLGINADQLRAAVEATQAA